MPLRYNSYTHSIIQQKVCTATDLLITETCQSRWKRDTEKVKSIEFQRRHDDFPVSWVQATCAGYLALPIVARKQVVTTTLGEVFSTCCRCCWGVRYMQIDWHILAGLRKFGPYRKRFPLLGLGLQENRHDLGCSIMICTHTGHRKSKATRLSQNASAYHFVWESPYRAVAKGVLTSVAFLNNVLPTKDLCEPCHAQTLGSCETLGGTARPKYWEKIPWLKSRTWHGGKGSTRLVYVFCILYHSNGRPAPRFSEGQPS